MLYRLFTVCYVFLRPEPVLSSFIAQNWILDTVQKGALTQLYAATMPEALELNGKVCSVLRNVYARD